MIDLTVEELIQILQTVPGNLTVSVDWDEDIVVVDRKVSLAEQEILIIHTARQEDEPIYERL